MKKNQQNSKTIKVNIWQLGFTTFKDYLKHDNSKAQCRDMGFVIINEKKDLWEEEVWNLLNWSCWNYDENGNAVKPENVKSPLTHCNSDIIINIDGTNKYLYAKHVEWGEADTLEEAINKMKSDFCDFWPFRDVRCTSGRVKQKEDTVFQEINGKWIEITW